MTDKSWKLLTKLIDACGYDITQIEDEFDFDELCEDIKNRLALVNNYSYDYECQQKANITPISENNFYSVVLGRIKEIAQELLLETNESDSCYYKDECGPNCYPKRRIMELEKQEPQGRTTYCQYEAVSKILNIIDKVGVKTNE